MKNIHNDFKNNKDILDDVSELEILYSKILKFYKSKKEYKSFFDELNKKFKLNDIQYLNTDLKKLGILIGQFQKIGNNDLRGYGIKGKSIVVMSDIHANLEALNAVLDDINLLPETKNAKKYCCGDIIGYGPNPIECAEIVKKDFSGIRHGILKGNCVEGNHDAILKDKTVMDNFNRYAVISSLWTISQFENQNNKLISGAGSNKVFPHKSIIPIKKFLNKLNLKGIYQQSKIVSVKKYLKGLDMIQNEKYFSIAHATVSKNDYPWGYVYDNKNINIPYLENCFDSMKNNVLFIGHSHTPYIHYQDIASKKIISEQIKVPNPSTDKKSVLNKVFDIIKYKVIVNVGSVGSLSFAVFK